MDDSWNTGNMKKKLGHLLCDRYKRFVFIIDCPVAQPQSCAKVMFLDVNFINTVGVNV
jgi:hypothetical protein